MTHHVPVYNLLTLLSLIFLLFLVDVCRLCSVLGVYISNMYVPHLCSVIKTLSRIDNVDGNISR